MFRSGVLGAEAANTKALIFNVKGEDLLFLDQPNIRSTDDEPRALRPARPGRRRRSRASPSSRRPARGDPNAGPDVSSRPSGVRAFYWTLAEFCGEQLLPFVFADAEDERQQYTMVVHHVTRQAGARRPRRWVTTVCGPIDGTSRCATYRGPRRPHRRPRDRRRDDARLGRARRRHGHDQRVRPAAALVAAPARPPRPRRHRQRGPSTRIEHVRRAGHGGGPAQPRTTGPSGSSSA